MLKRNFGRPRTIIKTVLLGVLLTRTRTFFAGINFIVADVSATSLIVPYYILIR